MADNFKSGHTTDPNQDKTQVLDLKNQIQHVGYLNEIKQVKKIGKAMGTVIKAILLEANSIGKSEKLYFEEFFSGKPSEMLLDITIVISCYLKS